MQHKGLFVVALALLGACEGNSVVSGAVGMDAAVTPVVSCAMGQVLCDGRCADLAMSREHCGACGNACPGGQVCVAGQCALACPMTQTACAGLCVQTDTDRAHCGACGRACGSGEVCAGGACTRECGPTLATCGGEDAGAARFCADTRVDRANCGACGNACAMGQSCVDGRCVTTCPPGQVLCGDACRDLRTDRAHCGACGTACAAGEVCAAGVCGVECRSGLSLCGGACRDLLADDAHCGACDRACTEGRRCVAGVCARTCAMGLAVCGDACRDLEADRAHCGVCDRACAAGMLCSNGACVLECAAGLTPCGNLCRDLLTDHAHCGACDRACGGGEVCTSGSCAPTCGQGQRLCGDRCADPQTDPAHCGACGNACPARANATPACAAGRCGYLCGAGFADCNGRADDGCETALGTPEACGACGERCVGAANTAASCVSGACRFECAAGFADCNGDPMDGCEAAVGGSCTVGVGACARGGLLACVGRAPACDATAGMAQAETCNGMDDDCDRATDEDLTRACYSGPMGTQGVGRCRGGTQRCVMGAFGGACEGEVLPAAEACGNGVDDDCDGMTDEDCQGTGLTCSSPTIVTASTSFSRNTCGGTDDASDTNCGTTGSPDHVYLVRLRSRATVSVQVTGFPSGGNEGDILYRGTSCPGSAVACTQHNSELRRALDAGDHYFLIEDDHANCQSYVVTFTIL